MAIEYKIDDIITAEEMQSLEASVGLGPHRTLERNQKALVGSLFVATARCEGQLVGLLRLVGDGAYILHVAGLSVHPDFQRQGVGRRLVQLAIAFARQIGVGTGENPGEYTLFANTGADRFYEKLGFVLAPNGMVLADTDARRAAESVFQEQWSLKRGQSNR